MLHYFGFGEKMLTGVSSFNPPNCRQAVQKDSVLPLVDYKDSINATISYFLLMIVTNSYFF